MSQQLINRSDDLLRLRKAGFDIEVRSGHLLVKDVPYVDATRTILRGVLVSALTLAGDVTVKPGTHVVYFIGSHPCRADGTTVAAIQHASGVFDLGDGIVAQHSFSNKPSEGYRDYYHMMTRYIDIISAYAQALDDRVTARTYPIIDADDESSQSVFQYVDNATSRAGIGAFTRRLRGQTVAILGIGGTGSYILDLIAKTPLREIHLYDGDVFSQHNAFRFPGAATQEALAQQPNKAVYFADQYRKVHKHVIAYSEHVSEANIDQLRGMDFVFVCVDNSAARRLIVTKLEEFGIPFVDVGIGIYMSENGLGGLVRVTTSTPSRRDHATHGGRIPFTSEDAHNEYSRNIQIAELNALNAALAVIKWKKLYGFYDDFEYEYFTTYSIGGNDIVNEEQGAEAEQFADIRTGGDACNP